MLLDVKQKSESDADILLSFDQSNCKVGSKSMLADWAPTCWRGPVTCERGRNASLKCVYASLKCVSPARSHTNHVPPPWRSLSSCHGIQHPGSGKKPVSRVRRQLAVQIPGLQSLLTESPPS